MNLSPALDERGVIIGKTGCGKTELAKQLLVVRPYVTVYDSKGLLRWPQFRRVTKFEELIRAQEPKLIYAPVHDELIDEGLIDRFFEWNYLRHNTTVYVDEVGAITHRNTIPKYYHACLTRGRELGISVISSTQTPKLIPVFIISESERFYVFRIQHPDHAKRVEEILGIKAEIIQNLPPHHFITNKPDGSIIGPAKLNLSSGSVQ